MISRYWFLVALASLVHVQTASADEPVVAYHVISDKSVNAGQLRDVVVRIEKPVSENAVREMAIRIKSNGLRFHPKTSIFFLLPGMEVNKGAWARAVFRPQLEVTILGATVEDQKALEAQRPKDGEAVGEWIRMLPGGSSHKITISQSADGKCKAVFTYPNGTQSSMPLKEVEAGRKYEKDPARFGEAYFINDSGHLELWDEQGRIETLHAVPR